MLHFLLRRCAYGATIPLIISAGKRTGQNPRPATIYQNLVEREKATTSPRPSNRQSLTSPH